MEQTSHRESPPIHNDSPSNYHCTAYIRYDFTVTATSPEDAEQQAFEALADDIVDGVIRTDIFPPRDDFSFPTLESVTVYR